MVFFNTFGRLCIAGSFILICLTGCSQEVYTITGKLNGIDKGSIVVECSSLYKKTMFGGAEEDIGYSCAIQVTEETVIESQTGEALILEDLRQAETVSVILTEKVEKKHLEDAVFVAKEIVMLTD